jgi:hypothetical protein
LIWVKRKHGQALGYFYFEDEPGRRSAAKLIECNTNPLISSPRHVAPPLNLIAFNY